MKLFTLGPMESDDETLAIGGTQSQYFRTPAFSGLMLEIEGMFKQALDAPPDTRIMFLTASGTGAMEATIINLFTPDDKLLIINGGSFGKRFMEMCAVHKIPYESIDLKWNEAFKPEMLNQHENKGFTGLLVTMHETSTGQLYPMDVISAFCKRNKLCFVVDAIGSFLCDPFSMKDLGVDAVINSSQKALSLHPGMSFVAVSNAAFDNRCAKIDSHSMYFDFKDYAANIKRGQTPFTPAVNIVNQLHDKLKRTLDVGVPKTIAYIAELAVYFRKAFSEQKTFTIPDTYPLSNAITPVYCPKQNAKEVFFDLMDNHGIYVTPCAGDIAPFLFRVAHMSQKLTRKDFDDLIALLKKF